MKPALFILSLVLLFTIKAEASAQENKELRKVWETSGFDIPECVLPDFKSKILYVSNLAGGPTEKNRKGFISKLSLDGTIIELKWAVGLNAPKGMAIHDETLYITDIDRLVRICLKTGEIIESIPVEGAVFLNDIVRDENGVLFVSDSKNSAIYKLTDNGIEKFISDPSFLSPNGFCYDNGNVLVGVGDRIVGFSADEQVWKDYILNTESVDGFSKVEEGIYIISAWNGKIHLAYNDKEKQLLLDTGSDRINTADFYFDSKTQMLYVPTFFANSVVAYRLSKK